MPLASAKWRRPQTQTAESSRIRLFRPEGVPGVEIWLVEAGGVEPPSENVSVQASTGLDRNLFSFQARLPTGRQGTSLPESRVCPGGHGHSPA